MHDIFVAKIIQEGLFCDDYAIHKTGGRIVFHLEAGKDNANRNYLILGSLDPTNPGFMLPGGQLLPFEWDDFTDAILLYTNTPTFKNFAGKLDHDGCSRAILSAKDIRPEFVGLHMYFAFCLNNPFNFVSNAAPIKIEW
jgi:hypothetical protein